jgi:peptidoglycan/LPS O-acetylase OafA/YrhL
MGVVSFFNNIVATGTFANGDAIGGLGFLAGTILFCYLCILLFRKVGEYRNGARLFLLVIFWLILIFYIGSVLYALLGFFATSPSLLWYVAMIIYSVILGVLIYLFQFNKDIVESYTMETK